MITFINDLLFSTITEKKEGKEGRPDYYRTIVNSAMNVLDKKGSRTTAPKVIEHILHTEEDNFNMQNTQIRLSWNENRPFVRLNQKESNTEDMLVYLIAIPYNGFIVPVEKTSMYQVYKGLTVTLEKPIDFEGDRYKHIAYVTLVPNQKILDGNAKVDEQTAEKQPCEFVLETYSTHEEGKGKEQTTVTVCKKWKIVFDADPAKTQIFTFEEVTDPVNFDEYRGKYIFALPEKPKDKSEKRENDKKSTSEKRQKLGAPNNKRNKPPQKNDGSKPTTKKGSNGNRAFGTPVVSKSLEEMIQEAENVGREKQRGRTKGNKRGKKKRR